MTNCTVNIPTCLAVGISNITFCNSLTISRIVYNYEICTKGSVVQIINGDHLECFCTMIPINECRSNMFSDECKSSTYMISCSQSAIAVFGFIFNLLVCLIYYRRHVTRKKIPNVLLVNQALVDLFNCIMFALPMSVLQILIVYKRGIYFKTISQYLWPVVDFTGLVSISSSVKVYFIVAFERWLAILKPLWHHANARKRHIWRAVMGAWFISFASFIPIIFLSHQNHQMYVECMQVVLVLVMVVITTVFFVTWYKALKEVRRNHQLGRSTVSARKELHLTILFAAMYFLFLLAYLPLAVADLTNPTIRIYILLFNLTALINPILTLTLKKDFKCCFHRQ